MIYRLDDLCESHDFEHDQKFVKAEHWKEACDEVNDLIKTKKELEEKLAISSQIMDAMTKTSQNNYKLTQQVKDIEQQLYQSNKERAELEIAVKALKFYGSPKNWKEDDKDLDDVCIIQTDWEMNGKVESYFCGGKLAREALAKINQK
jgi:predicted nuclease with TOPRIM domain